MLESFQADKGLIPASSIKVLVTAAALSVLGEDHRFHTRFYRTGEIAQNGTLKGDLVIEGGGDPSLGSTLMTGTPTLSDVLGAWSRAVREAGIRRVEGAVLADNRLFEGMPSPGSWAWEDLGNYYAAPADALSLNDNLYALVFAPGKSVGEEAALLRTEPEVPGLRFKNLMRTGDKDSGDKGVVYCVPDQEEAALTGTLPVGVPEFSIKGAVPWPALFAARSLKARLKSDGIAVVQGAALVSDESARSSADKGLLLETLSPPLKDIVRVTNKKSVNLYAEMLARALALKAGKKGSAQEGVAAVMEFLRSARVDISGLRLADACGLSRIDAVPAQAFTSLLSYMARQPSFAAFRDSLATPGVDEATGKARSFGQGGLEGRLWFKAGFVTGARGYCGYLQTRKGRLLSFAFLANNLSAPRADVEAFLKKRLISLAEKY